ncbi:hypothetical protein HAX54_028821 [Datura stramonium]|uniref:Uncharacterized protein n=1 Tax=Datura stramonium TaxID=4076 RepID=A0ABS8V522_DATST|nr:hypothetical protein [Datura stramonium]
MRDIALFQSDEARAAVRPLACWKGHNITVQVSVVKTSNQDVTTVSTGSLPGTRRRPPSARPYARRLYLWRYGMREAALFQRDEARAAVAPPVHWEARSNTVQGLYPIISKARSPRTKGNFSTGAVDFPSQDLARLESLKKGKAPVE